MTSGRLFSPLCPLVPAAPALRRPSFSMILLRQRTVRMKTAQRHVTYHVNTNLDHLGSVLCLCIWIDHIAEGICRFFMVLHPQQSPAPVRRATVTTNSVVALLRSENSFAKCWQRLSRGLQFVLSRESPANSCLRTPKQLNTQWLLQPASCSCCCILR